MAVLWSKKDSISACSSVLAWTPCQSEYETDGKRITLTFFKFFQLHSSLFISLRIHARPKHCPCFASTVCRPWADEEAIKAKTGVASKSYALTAPWEVPRPNNWVHHNLPCVGFMVFACNDHSSDSIFGILMLHRLPLFFDRQSCAQSELQLLSFTKMKTCHKEVGEENNDKHESDDCCWTLYPLWLTLSSSSMSSDTRNPV